jgi:hypothetical protein
MFINVVDSLHPRRDKQMHKLSDKYRQELKTKNKPIYYGMTRHGVVQVFECHVDGEDAPLVIVKNDTAYESDEYELSELKV